MFLIWFCYLIGLYCGVCYLIGLSVGSMAILAPLGSYIVDLNILVLRPASIMPRMHVLNKIFWKIDQNDYNLIFQFIIIDNITISINHM